MAEGKPLCPEIGVLALVPDPWDSVWMPRHYVLSRLGRYFPTLWLEPSPDWREALRSLLREPRLPPPPRPDLPGFAIHRPSRLLPRLYRPAPLARWTLRRRLAGACAELRRRGCRSILAYLWRPEFAPALQTGLFDLSCYHIDDEYSFAERDQPIPPAERQILESVDQVIIHSPALMDKKGQLNPHTIQVPNGVDFARFSAPVAEPADLAAVPHPRIGYVGVIKVQLDLEKLDRLAARHPGYSFVLVGPLGYLGDKGGFVQSLRKRPNVHFLGHKPVTDLPAYTRHMDVAMLCYSQTDYTNFIYPLKIHESLASGVPVVATPIRSLQAFADVIEFATELDDWSAALERALAMPVEDPAWQAPRRAIAAGHDWNLLVNRIARALAERAGPEFAARIPAEDRLRQELLT
ncbi:MAG: glycosyltransferase family 1 protein [Gammaproteobacteria bacterium]|nr:MAG: glycosyltransferase family 1 protein [Gammaproteobacteria bacterium]